MANTHNSFVPLLQVPRLARLRYDAGSAFPEGTLVQIIDASKVTPQFRTQLEVFEPSTAPDGPTRNRAINTLYCFVKIHRGRKLSFVHTVTSGAASNMLTVSDVGPVSGTHLRADEFKPGDMVCLKRPLIDPSRASRFPDKPAKLNVSTIPKNTLCFLHGYASTTAPGAVREKPVLRGSPNYALIFAVETLYKGFLAYGRALPAQVFDILPPNDPAYRLWQHEVNNFSTGNPEIVNGTPEMLDQVLQYIRLQRHGHQGDSDEDN
ncbi:hypothetical protein K474DRAFT_1670039 [Panus rudis PR-1116 ss-1]|nr:hypothetical protein K474DRAFT_1670039 [Panus rudis PR-1116 ss-1]